MTRHPKGSTLILKLGFDFPEAIGDLPFVWAMSSDSLWRLRVGDPYGEFEFFSMSGEIDDWHPLGDSGYDFMLPGWEAIGTIHLKESFNGNA